MDYCDAEKIHVRIVIEAHPVGPLCVHPALGGLRGYAITHIATGASMAAVYRGDELTFEQAVRAAKAMGDALTDEEWGMLKIPPDPDVLKAHGKKLFPAYRAVRIAA